MQKKILIILTLFCLSCEGLFHENDTQYMVIDNRQELLDVLNGIYSWLTEVYDQPYFITLSRSDDINPYFNYYFAHDHGSCTSSGLIINIPGITGNIYLNFYKAVITINHLIQNLNEADDGEILGELYFLRAYSFFQLARLFGTPPIITDTDVNYLVEKPTYEEVYNFIETDMQYALELLPDTYTDARIPGETPHKGTAKALLAEIYLARAGFPVNDESKYAEAAQIAGEVIQQADYYGFGLLPDFANLWKVAYRHNTECIFGLFFSTDDEETSNRIGGNYLCYYHFQNYASYLGACGQYNSDFSFFITYPDSYRKYHSFNTGYYHEMSYDTLLGTESRLEFFPYDPLDDPCNFVGGAISIKWIDIDAMIIEGDHFNEPNEVTLYLLRYAQTLLTYAEAKARSGNLDETCYEAVNMVRRRAHNLDLNTPSEFDLTPDLSAEQFLDSVVWERAWELCTEPQGRWFDIVRLDLRDEIEANHYPEDIPFVVDKEFLNEDWYFYLIPQEDRWVNPNFSEESD